MNHCSTRSPSKSQCTGFLLASAHPDHVCSQSREETASTWQDCQLKCHKIRLWQLFISDKWKNSTCYTWWYCVQENTGEKEHQCYKLLIVTEDVQVVRRKTKENSELGVVLQCMELSPCHIGDSASDELQQFQRALLSPKTAPHLLSSEKSPTITLCSRRMGNGKCQPAVCPRSFYKYNSHQAGPTELKDVTQPEHRSFLQADHSGAQVFKKLSRLCGSYTSVNVPS